ncbi:ent-kaurenoic acid oxidase 2-like [Hibiscus syriacus]|uniref:ent-kaurenoic acid oxidase 2-like n=1 Tax=Hibiscus syriacus TaxID=106335 RepID=UPI0019245111|nr:ent-kaurenoic acid oxidase 2-like [Hibiscus syriacus]
MDLDLLCLFVAIIVGALCVFSLGNPKQQQRLKPLPPGDMGWPLLGNMWSFVRAFKSQNPESFISNLKQRYGETGVYKIKFFWKPCIIVCSPELCRKVLTDDEQFQLGYPLSNLVCNGTPLDCISSSVNKWFRRLTAATGLNQQESLSSYIGSIEEIVIGTLEEWSKTNKPILFFPEVNKIAFKVMMTIFLGSGTNDTSIESMEKYYTDVFGGLFCMPINIPGFAYNRAVKAREMLMKGIRGVLKERKHDVLNSKRGLIDFIREADDPNGEELDDELVAIILLLFLIAGRESSGRVAAWATVFLHDHPRVLQKAKEEQEEIMRRRSPSQKGD